VDDEQRPRWRNTPGASGLAVAIIGILKVTVGEDSAWGPYIAAGVVALGVWLAWLLWRSRLR
jgi:ABC-type transport system involved in cytochrome c biogenesis permease component